MNQDRPLKVLVSCFKFSPVKGSEFATGWNYVKAISLRHKVWVVTRSNERERRSSICASNPARCRM